MKKQKNKNAILLGKLGGEKTKEKYGTEHYKKMSQLGVESRKKLSTKQVLTDQAVGV